MARTPSAAVIGITTFDKRGKFDEGAMRFHCQRIAAAGIAFFAGGSSPGEQYSMTTPEVEKLLKLCVKELKGKVRIGSMGVEARSLKQMLEFLKLAEASGVDVTQIYSLDLGHGNKPVEVELEHYWRKCLESVTMPCVISSHMGMGYYTPPAMMARLVKDYPHLVGFHLTSPDIGYLVQSVKLLPERVSIHTGGSQLAVTSLAVGASGFLTSDGNVIPKISQSVITHWKKGNYQKAFDAYHTVMKFQTRPFVSGSSARSTKAAMQILGLPGAYTRDPHLPLTEAETALLKKHIADCNIKKLEGL